MFFFLRSFLILQVFKINLEYFKNINRRFRNFVIKLISLNKVSKKGKILKFSDS